MASLKPLGDVI